MPNAARLTDAVDGTTAGEHSGHVPPHSPEPFTGEISGACSGNVVARAPNVPRRWSRPPRPSVLPRLAWFPPPLVQVNGGAVDGNGPAGLDVDGSGAFDGQGAAVVPDHGVPWVLPQVLPV